MSALTRPRQWRVSVAFEPNRFSAEALSTVYQQLKPADGRVVTSQVTRNGNGVLTCAYFRTWLWLTLVTKLRLRHPREEAPLHESAVRANAS